MLTICNGRKLVVLLLSMAKLNDEAIHEIARKQRRAAQPDMSTNWRLSSLIQTFNNPAQLALAVSKTERLSRAALPRTPYALTQRHS
jgi:hypothetical protein